MNLDVIRKMVDILALANMVFGIYFHFINSHDLANFHLVLACFIKVMGGTK